MNPCEFFKKCGGVALNGRAPFAARRERGRAAASFFCGIYICECAPVRKDLT